DGVLGGGGGGADVHEQDPAGVEDDGGGVAGEVLAVARGDLERSPGAAAVRGPLEHDVDVPVVGGGVDAALAGGEEGAGPGGEHSRGAEAGVAVLSGAEGNGGLGHRAAPRVVRGPMGARRRVHGGGGTSPGRANSG